MRVAFLIERRNFYRLFGPIVERALARAQYVDKFVGFDDGKSSDRVLDAVQSLVERGGPR